MRTFAKWEPAVRFTVSINQSPGLPVEMSKGNFLIGNAAGQGARGLLCGGVGERVYRPSEQLPRKMGADFCLDWVFLGPFPPPWHHDDSFACVRVQFVMANGEMRPGRVPPHELISGWGERRPKADKQQQVGTSRGRGEGGGTCTGSIWFG